MAANAVSHSGEHCRKCGGPVEPHAKYCTHCGAPLTFAEVGPLKQRIQASASDRADVCLKRAWGLIKDVEEATDRFRQRAIEHNAQVEGDQALVSSLVTMFRGGGKLKREKQSLLGDLELAASEIDKAVALNPETTLRVDSAVVPVAMLRATIMHFKGQIEVIWGQPERAKAIWLETVRIAEFPDPHYMLGLLYEDEYRPSEALKHFERCLELDPDGDLSVPALREANAMRHYKKRFRGSWLLCGLMLLFFFPAAILYFAVKYR